MKEVGRERKGGEWRGREGSGEEGRGVERKGYPSLPPFLHSPRPSSPSLLDTEVSVIRQQL